MSTEIFLGKPPANIEQWIKDHATPPTPTPPNGKVWFKTSSEQTDWSEEDAYISDGAFDGFASKNSAVEVIIPSKDASGNDVTSVGFSAFYNCSRLTSATIPDSVRSIGSHAFFGCSGLTSVTIPDSVTSIGHSAFSDCSSLTNVTIPNNVTSIGSGAFSGCTNLTSVTIGNGVTSIGDNAFYNCSGLTSVTIPDSVTSIGRFAFSGCSGLMSFTVGDGNANYKSVNGLLLSRDGKTLVAVPGGLTSVTIPDSVTSIGNDAFYCCSGLTSVTIGDSVTSLGNGAFGRCSGLSSVTIGTGVTSIGVDAFYNCTSANDVYCWPNPANLTWNEGDKDDFKSDGSTVCHVKAEYLAAYQTKFGDEVNATFVGDLA